MPHSLLLEAEPREQSKRILYDMSSDLTEVKIRNILMGNDIFA